MTEPPTPQAILDVPAGFVGLPITGGEETDAGSRAALAERVAAHTGDSAEQLAAYLTWLTADMASAGVRVFGKFAVGDDDPALATLVLADTPLTEIDNSLVTANRTALTAALLKRYVERNPHADARTVTLQSGPAMAAIVTGEYRLPPELTERDEEVVVPVFRAEFQIPAPDGSRLTFLTISADSVKGWPQIAEQAVSVANSVRLGDRAE